MLKEAGLVEENPDGFTKKRADIIFCTVTRNRGNMIFDTFLQSLIKIGEFIYPESNASTALQQLVRGAMIPLHERIQQQ